MADKEFNVKISVDTKEFNKSMEESEKKSNEFADALGVEVTGEAKATVKELDEIIKRFQKMKEGAIDSTSSVKGLGTSLSDTSRDADSANDVIAELGIGVSVLDSDFNNTSSSANGFGTQLEDIVISIRSVTDSISDLRKELKSMQADTIKSQASLAKLREELKGVSTDTTKTKTSTEKVNKKFKETSTETDKFSREMKKLSMVLGGEVPEGTRKAYEELAKLHREARTASKMYGKYSQQALGARDAITTFALGLDDAAFKQIYMRSQLGLTDMQLRQQANSIKLNARMTKLMGNQTQILTQRMEGLARHGIKPEDLLPPSTIGQFQLMNETMAAGQAPISRLSGAYRKFGASMDKTIKGWSAQKIAIKAAQGDMTKYGLLTRGITAGLGNMAIALSLVGMGAIFAYKTMFKSALEADESLKKLADTTKGKVMQALGPLIETAGQFLEVVFKITGAVADWITKFNEAHPVIAKIVSVIGFLLPAMTLLLLPLGWGLGLFTGWKLILGAVWPLISGVVALIGTASATFLTFAAVIGVVVAAFIYLWKTNEGFRDACIAIWEAIKVTIQAALEAIKQFFIEHGDTIKAVLQTAYETLKTIVMTVMTAIGEVVKLILDSIKQFWDEHGESIMQAVKTIYETVKTIVLAILEALSIVIKSMLDVIKSFWDKHGEMIKTVAKNAWEFIKSTIDSFLNIIKSIVLAITSAINGDWDTFWNEMGNIAKTALGIIENIIKFAINNFPKIIAAGASLAINAMINLLTGIINAAKSFGTNMMNVGKDLIMGMINGVKNMASRLIKSVTGVIGNAIDAAKSLLGINSPSKLFMQFGEWTAEGYQIGVDRGEPSSTRAVESFANNSIEAFSTNALPQDNVSSNSSLDNSNVTININAGQMNSEQDMYRLAEIIDKKLLEIQQQKSKMFGGYQHV